MFWFVSAIVLLLPSYLIRWSFFGVPTTLLEVAIYLSIIGTLVSRPIAQLTDDFRPFLQRYGWPVGLFLLSALVSTVMAPDKRLALGLLKGYIIDPILLGLVVIASINDQKKLNRSFLFVIGGALLASLSAFVATKTLDGRALGIYSLDAFASPNFLALYLAPLSAFSLGVGLTAKNNRHRLIGIISFIVTIIALCLTGSRGAFLSVAITTLATLLWWLSSRQPKFYSLSRILLIVLAIGSIAGGAWLARPNFDNPDHRTSTSNNLRYEIWRTTIVDILPKTAILGVGLGNYQNYFTELTRHRVNFPEYISPWARTPHNIFLTLWTNLGFIGLVSFIWLIVLFFIDLSTAKTALVYKISLAMAMIAILTHGMVDAAYWKNDLAALFWVLIALNYRAVQLTPRTL